MQKMKWVLIAVAAVVVLVVAALVAVPFLVDTPRVQAMIATQASSALARPVTFDAVSVRVLPLPGVVLRGLEVADHIFDEALNRAVQRAGPQTNAAGGPLGVWRQWGDRVDGRAISAGHFFPEERRAETADALGRFFGGEP